MTHRIRAAGPFGVAFAFGAALATSSVALSGTLDGAGIRSVLEGNSMVHPNFGCVFLQKDGTFTHVAQSGEKSRGDWGVRGELYTSSGQCGSSGCQLSGTWPEYTFNRIGGGYSQTVIVIQGNHCEKDGIVS
ncbi:MAG: hypothetical protein WBO55_18315 [Rhizobiaceae bacterium]